MTPPPESFRPREGWPRPRFAGHGPELTATEEFAMKSKRTAPVVALGILMLVGAALIGCSSDELAHLLGGGFGPILHTPKFLIAVEDTSSPDNVSVFSVDPTTGVLTAVSGSPFTTGLSDGSGAVTHPSHGDWVYVADWS